MRSCEIPNLPRHLTPEPHPCPRGGRTAGQDLWAAGWDPCPPHVPLRKPSWESHRNFPKLKKGQGSCRDRLGVFPTPCDQLPGTVARAVMVSILELPGIETVLCSTRAAELGGAALLPSAQRRGTEPPGPPALLLF